MILNEDGNKCDCIIWFVFELELKIVKNYCKNNNGISDK